MLPHCRLASALVLAALMSGCAWQQTVPSAPTTMSDQQVERHSFPLFKDSEMIGSNAAVITQSGDTLPDIARHFALGLQAINDANPDIDTWVPEPGSRVALPMQWILPDAPHKGVVVNLPAMRLFYYPEGKGETEVRTYPVGIGREDWNTPTGTMSIDRKMANPTWFVPESVRREHAEKGDPLPAAVPPGPENPLGAYALYLDKPSYLIHGTDKPYGVGLRASHGCLRLYPEDIERLFKEVSVKTPVRIVNQPYLVGHRFDGWYLEAHTPLDTSDEKRARKTLMASLKKIALKHPGAVDWNRVNAILKEAKGIAEPVGEEPAPLAVVERPSNWAGAPAPVEYEPNRWYVEVLDTKSETLAQRFAAMVNHQGPPIPALVQIHKTGSYRVLAGPFKAADAAKKARNRLQTDFEMASLRLLNPKDTKATALP